MRRRLSRAAAGRIPPSSDRREPLDLADIRNSLKSLMWRNCRRPPRRASGCRKPARTIDHWCGYVLPPAVSPTPAGWELQNMLTVARLMIEAALRARKRRGVHLRTDFPQRDDDHWRRRIAFRRGES